MTAISEKTIVHAHVYNPSRSLFGKKSDRAYCKTISCSNLECPLLARGQCVNRLPLNGANCPYSSHRGEEGPTQRARSFYRWIEERRERYKDVPCLDMPPNKMEYIGEYVYLPYSHMAMCEHVPFLRHSSLFISGNPFIRREDWGIDLVLTLVNFRPHALMGGEIKSYQREQVPLFIQHLREVDQELFAELAKCRPEYGVAPNYVGRKAVLSTLNHPISWTNTSSKNEYPVTWEWDGAKVRTTSGHAYQKTWGGIPLDDLELIATPKAGATVDVMSNDWVNENTVFVD